MGTAAVLVENSLSAEASAVSRLRAVVSLQFEVAARRASESACVCIFVKSEGAGAFGGGMIGDEMAAAEVAVAQSQARPFQRAIDHSSFWGLLARPQLISRNATAWPVSHSRSPLQESVSSFQCF